MSVLCACGQLATHRVRWNEWNEASEPIRSKRPSRCATCAWAEAERATQQARSERAYEMQFSDLSRRTYVTTTPVPHAWVKLARQTCKRHGWAVNPKGYTKVYQKDCYLVVDIYPPLEKTATWTPEHVLFSLRYLMRQPLHFREVPRDESPSPATLRESREQSIVAKPLSVIGSPR